jgi:WhiB family transcriptional regulator, redox-sensing transcriptional regulator
LNVNTEWMADGACRDASPEVFFPRDGAGVIAAQHICAQCPVTEQCLDYAIALHIDHGIWGGNSERERRRIARERRRLRVTAEFLESEYF